MTRTRQAEPSAEMAASFEAFRAGSSRTPRNQAVTNARPDGGVLPDPAGEDERVHPAEGRGQGPDPLAGGVEEQLNGLGRPRVGGRSGQQVAEAGAGFRHAEQAGPTVHEVFELVGGQAVGPHEVDQHPDRGRRFACP